MGGRYKLKILTPAQRELEEIAQVHRSLSGPQSARAIVETIYSAMEQLSHFPQSGPPIRDPQLRDMGYRSILAGKYLLFYRLHGDAVVIYHIAHGASDYPNLFRAWERS